MPVPWLDRWNHPRQLRRGPKIDCEEPVLRPGPGRAVADPVPVPVIFEVCPIGELPRIERTKIDVIVAIQIKQDGFLVGHVIPMVNDAASGIILGPTIEAFRVTSVNLVSTVIIILRFPGHIPVCGVPHGEVPHVVRIAREFGAGGSMQCGARRAIASCHWP